MTCFCRSIQERAVKLLIRSTKIHEKFQNFIYNFVRTSFRTVNLVDTYDYMEIKFKGFLKNEFSLRHSTFESVNEKNNTVYHFKYTFYFAAEISMSWCVDDINFCIFVMNSCILG